MSNFASHLSLHEPSILLSTNSSPNKAYLEAGEYGAHTSVLIDPTLCFERHEPRILTVKACAWFFLCFVAGYVISRVIYRLYWHPLASFPGPLYARCSFLYEFYYDWFRRGTYYRQIEAMHEKYGPVVRVTPDELHVRDPSFYNQLFVPAAVRKSDGNLRMTQGTGFEDVTAVINPHDRHRNVRAPLDPFFSRAGATRCEERVRERVRRFAGRIQSVAGTEKVINLTDATMALVTDINSSLLFEEPSDYLGVPDFEAAYFDRMRMGTQCVSLFKNIPFLPVLVTAPILRRLVEYATNWRVWDDKARRQVFSAKLRTANEAKNRSNTTIIDHLVHSDNDEKVEWYARLTQLLQEAGAQNFAAATVTMTFYLLDDARRRDMLRDELARILLEAANAGRAPSWRDLEQGQYASGCIKESLRLATAAMSRLGRVSPDVDLVVNGTVISKGTPVSMTSYYMHRDPAIFPEPHSFVPERWMTADAAKLKIMNDYYVPFSKGSRSCIGKNIVQMAMHFLLLGLFQPGAPTMKLFDTDASDVEPVHGYLFSQPRYDSKGVRITVE